METNEKGMLSVEDLREQKDKLAKAVEETTKGKSVDAKQGAADIDKIRNDQVELNVIQKQAQESLEYYEALKKKGLLQDEPALVRARELVRHINNTFEKGDEKAKGLMDIKEINEIVEKQAYEIQEDAELTIKLEQKKEAFTQKAKVWYLSFQRAIEDAKASCEQREKIREELDESNKALLTLVRKKGEDNTLYVNGTKPDEDYREQLMIERKQISGFNFKRKRNIDALLTSEALRAFEDNNKKWNNLEHKNKSLQGMVISNEDLIDGYVEIMHECEEKPEINFNMLSREVFENASSKSGEWKSVESSMLRDIEVQAWAKSRNKK